MSNPDPADIPSLDGHYIQVPIPGGETEPE